MLKSGLNFGRVILAYAIMIGVVASVVMPIAPAHAAAGINQQINFQGRLFNAQGATVPDGYYNIQFKIYQDGDGQTVDNTTGSPAGSLKWTESWINQAGNGVMVKNGFISVQLGSITPFGSSVDWDQDTLWLSMNIGNTNVACTPFASCSPDGEMTPMKRLSATPYALNAGRLGGLTAAGFIQNQNTSPQAATNYYIDGIGKAATGLQGPSLDTIATGTLTIGGVNATAITLSQNTTVASGKTFQVGGNAPTATQASIQSSVATNRGLTIQGASGQTADLLDMYNSSGNFLAGFSAAGKLYVNAGINLGTTTAAGAVTLKDGTVSGFAATLNSSALTANQTVSLGDESGTVCLQSSANCGFVTGTTASYIQNQNSGAQATSNFWISGTGIATTLQAATIDTSSGTTTLNIGTTNATSGINLNQSTVLAADKSLTITGSNTRPASPTPGMLYYDTATKQLLVYANSKWQADRSSSTKIVGTSAAGGASSAVASMAPDGADYVNTSTTSAQTVINSALSAASSAGGTVYLMEGTYVIDGAISIPNNVTLAGAGNGTVIKLKNATNSDVYMLTNTDGTTGTRIGIRDLNIEGNKANQSSGIQIGIHLFNMGGGTGGSARDGAKINNVNIQNTLKTALYLNASSNNTITGVTIKHADNDGIQLNASSNNILSNNTIQASVNSGINLINASSKNTITNNLVQGNLWDGLDINASLNNTVTGNTFEGNSETGIFLDDGDNNAITGNQVSNNLLQGIFLSNTANENTVSGNKLDDNGDTTTNNSIVITSSDHNSITSNDITDNSATTNNYAINISNNTSDKNYLADNRFSSAPATAAINDAGTGTVYANQSRAENGGQQTVRTADDATAFQIQNAAGTGLFTVDSTGNGTITAPGQTLLGGFANQTQLIVKANTSQTSDLIRLQDANGAVLSAVNANGGLNTYGTNNTFAGLVTPTQTTGATGTNFYYVVTATNAAGETVASNSIGRASSSSTITWNQVTGATGYKVYRNTSNSFAAGSLLLTTITNGTTVSFTDSGAATGAGLPPTAPAGTKTVLQAWQAQGGSNIFEVQTSTGAIVAGINGSGSAFYGTSSSNGARLSIVTNATTMGAAIKGASGQSSDLLQLQDNNANVNASFNGAGNQLTLGRISGSGTVTQGKIVLADGTTSGFGTTLQSATLTTNNQTIIIPDTAGAGGTICLQNSASCGFVTGSSADYIQNQNVAAQATANYWISGTGKAVGGFQGPSLDAAAAGSLTIGGTTATSLVMQTSNVTRATLDSSNNLYLGNGAVAAAPNNFAISGTTSSTTGVAGGSLTIKAGGANTGSANGGDLSLSGGNGVGTGVQGIVKMSSSAYTSVTNTACNVNCTITQSNVDNYSTVIISSTGTDIVITLPAPTTSVGGRILYVTTTSGSNDFTLAANSGGNALNVTMRQNTTATMIWNGTAWTPGGASNAITLQATYNNGSNPSTTPEIKLDSVRGTIDIQDADTTIGADILNIRGSNPGNLGTVLFGVSNSGRVTIQGTTDDASAFRVLNSAGNYLFNINSSNEYVISNAVSAPGNDINNPGFEAGGDLTGGEEGWFGSSQGTIITNVTHAHSGNSFVQVLPNGVNQDVYAGSYREVTPGDDFFFSGYVKNSAGTNGTAGIQITWYDKDKAILSYSTDYATLPGTSYVERVINAAVPSNAKYAKFSATVRSTSNVGLYYFDDFYLSRSSNAAPYTYRNAQDSSTAFRIQSANSAQTLFTANTSNNTIKIGDSTGTDTATTLLVLDSTTADPTTLTGKNGGLFYRSDNNSLKAVLGGTVVDICTTAVTCTGYSASAGSAIQLQASTPGTQQTGNFNITGTGILTQLQTQDNGSGSTQALVIRSGNSSGGNSGNLTLDVGTATGTTGSITIGHSGVVTTTPGTLRVQGGGATASLALGTASTNSSSILFYTSAGANTVTLKAPSSNPTSSYSLTLPQDLGSSGDCIKINATGDMYFQGCGVGVNFNLQDSYNNSGTPATIALSNGKDLVVNAQDTATDPNVLFNLQCVTTCGTNGRFAIQNAGTDVFEVNPNNGGIVLGIYTQVGSSTTDATQTNFQLDSYNGTSDSGACSTTVNQGAMYYNTSMGSIRSCINGSWVDVSNPDTLGLLTFGIVPSSGGTNNAYDLPSLINNGSSGPCKVSWASNNSVSIQACVAYSSGRRVNVSATTLYTNAATTNNTLLTTANRWGHICLTGTNNQPAFTSTAGLATAVAGMPTFNATNPVLCIADVVGSATTGALIDDIYDVRTFTSAMKEAVITSTASELGMVVDAASNGAMTPAVSASQKLYGTIVATDGATSAGAPNAIVTTVGPAWVKANAGTAGQFVKTSTTNGYSNTISAIPNNSFYYSVGNTRTSWSTTCTASTNCAGSLYVNLIVR